MTASPILLSYPPRHWRIRGGANFRSRELPETHPKAALQEWLSLAEALTELGVMCAIHRPPEIEPTLTGLAYTANYGAWFPQTSVFLVSRMFVEHRQDEWEWISKFAGEVLGLEAVQAEHPWEGQADIATVAPDRFILTWGVRSSAEACKEVSYHLGDDAHVLSARLREPYFHGDTCLNVLPREGAPPILMVYPGALVDATTDDLKAFTGAELMEISEEEARAYACNALVVGKTILAPDGIGESLQQRLVDAGFEVRLLSLPELFGKGGGGPRCLANQLRGLTPNAVPVPARYTTMRDAIVVEGESYPESA